MTDGESAFSRIDEWFTKWHLPDVKKLTVEDANKALEELEKLVEEYAVLRS